MRTITILFVLSTISLVDASDRKQRGRTAWAWASTAPVAVTYGTPMPVPPDAKSESSDALAEVNSYRAKRGLAPFKHDSQLTQAAYEAAKRRASRGIHGHLPESDFSCLPAGANADAAGCAALDDSWGWQSCCADDNYSHAGAAWVRGSDGRRYMHLFVRNEPVAVDTSSRSTGIVTDTYSSCSNNNCSTGSWSSGRNITRGRRGR